MRGILSLLFRGTVGRGKERRAREEKGSKESVAKRTGEGRTGQRSTALGARKKAIEGSSREEEGEEITKQQGDLAMEFS